MDIGSLMKLKQMWGTFCANHPRFPDFLKAVKDAGVQEGTELTVIVSYPDGKTLKSGIRLKKEDVEILDRLMK